MFQSSTSDQNRILLSGIIPIFSTIIILIFFVNIDFVSPDSYSHTISIKPLYTTWVWVIYTVSIIISDLILSKPNNQPTAYTNPIFKFVLRGALILSLLGTIVSLLPTQNDWLQNNAINQIADTASQFLNSIFILFVFLQLGVGLTRIQRYFRTSI